MKKALTILMALTMLLLSLSAFVGCDTGTAQDTDDRNTQAVTQGQPEDATLEQTWDEPPAVTESEDTSENDTSETDIPETDTSENDTPETDAPEADTAPPTLDMDTYIQELIDAMTIEEKVGQLFVVRRPQNRSEALEAVVKYHIGGFTLYAVDFENSTPMDLRKRNEYFQSKAKIPLFCAVDEEGGRVIRASKYSAFRESGFLSPRELMASGGLSLVWSDTLEKSAFLKDLGINLNYAPVCDVPTSDQSYIYDRTAGDDAEEVAAYVETVVNAMNQAGMIGSLKHFPGYGDNVDTHGEISIDNRPMSQFLAHDLKPFEAGIKAGAPLIMVSHNIVTCMDASAPASLSPVVYRYLRKVMGFDGVIMTDSLDMGAITQYTGDEASAVAAVLAGCDLLCCTSYTVQIPAVLEAVKNGTITEQRIDQSLTRILTLKIKMGIISM